MVVLFGILNFLIRDILKGFYFLFCWFFILSTYLQKFNFKKYQSLNIVSSTYYVYDYVIYT